MKTVNNNAQWFCNCQTKLRKKSTLVYKMTFKLHDCSIALNQKLAYKTMGRICDSCIRDNVLHTFVSAMTNMVLYSSRQKKSSSSHSSQVIKMKLFRYYKKKFGSSFFPYKYVHMKMHVCVSCIRCTDLQILLVRKRN